MSSTPQANPSNPATGYVDTADAEADKKKLVVLSIRLNPTVHDALRRIAFDRRVSIHSLLLEGVEHVRAKYSANGSSH